MKKLFTFLIGGAIAIPLSVLATAQIERTLNPLWGVETEVDDNNLLAAKTLKEKVDGNDASYSLKLTELQKTRLLKHSKTKSATGNERIPMRSVMQLKASEPFESDVNAKITLNVQDDWGDGTGFQMIFDADHNTYGEGLDFDYDYFNAPDYSSFEYVLPEGGTINSTQESGGCLFAGESASIEIPAGIYDFVLTNPDGGDAYLISRGDFMGDDFEFEAGLEYIFTVVEIPPYITCILDVPRPVNLAVTEITSLETSTALTDSEVVTATVVNEGTLPISSFNLKLTVDDIEVATETVNQTLEPDAQMEYTFTAKADLSVEGVHTVAVEAIADGDGDDSNNTATVSVTHFAPADIPYTVDFSDESQLGECSWKGNGWSYNMLNGAMAFNGTEYQPLVFRGMNLQAGKSYVIGLTFAAGYELFGETYAEKFKVVCGLEGTPVDEWKDALSYEGVYTENYFVSDEAVITCEQTGVYSIAIVPVESSGTLFIKNINVAAKLEYDAVLAFVNAPTMLPEPQAGKFLLTANIINNGVKEIESATVVVNNGETEVGRAKIEGIAVNDTVPVPVNVTLTSASVGTSVNLEVAVLVDGHESEDTNDDNTAAATIEITEDVLGYDKVEQYMFYDENYHIGIGVGYISCGVPFHLETADVLTGISIGWGEVLDQNIQIAVYQFDPETLSIGNEIYSATIPQGEDTGHVIYKTTPRMLEAGDYIASVRYQGYCLVSDYTENGVVYVTSSNRATPQYGLGTSAIRTVFGEGEAMAKDALVTDFLNPADEGLFSVNEPVVVSVRNDGYEDVTGKLTLSINGVDADEQQVSLEGYSSEEFTFETDLSKPGKYELKVTVAVDGDQNADNNSLTKVVTSWEPADPYTVDFEKCLDFSTSGFNPAWRTVDVDNGPVWGLGGYDYPLPSNGRVAFMIFNPALTNPSLAGHAAIAPHSGERFAASFAVDGMQNNDWLISPKLTLPTEDANMSFFVKSYSGEYGLEQYNVLVSETDDEIESFVKIGETREAPEDAWMEVNVDLSEYAGKDVYLAIQCVSDDTFLFMLDDINVSKGGGSVSKNTVVALSIYPNPATDMVVISSGGSVIENVDIYNAADMMVCSSPVSDGSNFRYNVSTFDAGIYFAKVTTSDGTKVMRFIVK